MLPVDDRLDLRNRVRFPAADTDRLREVGGEVRTFIFLSRIRIAAYLTCVAYWAIMLWREEQPGRAMTQEMRQSIFTLQRQVEYHLHQLRSRKKL